MLRPSRYSSVVMAPATVFRCRPIVYQRFARRLGPKGPLLALKLLSRGGPLESTTAVSTTLAKPLLLTRKTSPWKEPVSAAGLYACRHCAHSSLTGVKLASTKEV